MARASNQVTTQEMEAYVRFCTKNDIINDDAGTPDSLHNAEVVLNYFLETWKQEMNDKNFDLAFEHLRPHLKLYQPHEQEFRKLHSSLDAKEKEAFRTWKGERGLKTTSCQNGVALLSWIKAHGFRVTTENLQLAVGQSRVQPFLEWDESATPRNAPDPRQHQSDGTGFLGKDGVNEPRWKRIQREREEREARDGINRSATSSQSVLARDAQNRAEQLRGNTHSESEQIGRIFVTAGTDIDWPATLQARLSLQKQFNKQQEVRRFAR